MRYVSLFIFIYFNTKYKRTKDFKNQGIAKLVFLHKNDIMHSKN